VRFVRNPPAPTCHTEATEGDPEAAALTETRNRPVGLKATLAQPEGRGNGDPETGDRVPVAWSTENIDITEAGAKLPSATASRLPSGLNSIPYAGALTETEPADMRFPLLSTVNIATVPELVVLTARNLPSGLNATPHALATGVFR